MYSVHNYPSAFIPRCTEIITVLLFLSFSLFAAYTVYRAGRKYSHYFKAFLRWKRVRSFRPALCKNEAGECHESAAMSSGDFLKWLNVFHPSAHTLDICSCSPHSPYRRGRGPFLLLLPFSMDKKKELIQFPLFPFIKRNFFTLNIICGVGWSDDELLRFSVHFREGFLFKQ